MVTPMIKCAIIKDGAVVNLIEYAEVPVGCPDGFDGDVIAVVAGDADIGWSYIDGKLIGPQIPEKPIPYDVLRKAAYPPIEDYIDGVVKSDAAQVQAYIDACLAVKAKYPKPGDPNAA